MACTRQHPPLDATLVAVPYAYPWSALISNFKFGQRPGWADFFSELLLASPAVRSALAHLQAKDLILPMPLSAQRLQLRGFNQAWELARALARQSACQGHADALLLLRLKHTRAQTELTRPARLANVKGAFQVDPLRVAQVQGRRVVLVDDVMTSGASLFAAAQALRAAGAAHVTGVVIARTE